MLKKLFIVSASFLLLFACSEKPTSDLDKILDITVKTMDKFQKTEDKFQKTESTNASENSDDAMAKFATQLAKDINAADPKVSNKTIGIVPKLDGSYQGFADENENLIKDSGESELFKLEIDAENKRLIASSDGEVRTNPLLAMGAGFLAGMLVSKMLNRQKTAGVNPANKKSTPRGGARNAANSSNNSARSRSGSGSHATGK